VISLVGGFCGVVLAVWGVDALAALTPDDVPRMQHVGLNRYVLGFALAITLLTSLLFGLAPALSVSCLNLHESLKDAGRTLAGSRRRRLRSALVVSEVAVALVLLVGAGLLTRSFQRVMDIDPGFNPNSMLEFYMDVGFSKPLDLPQRAAFYDELLQRIEGLPGVETALAGTSLPLWGSRIGFGVVIEGRPMPPRNEIQSARYGSITPDYFQGLGIPLLRGRFFTEADGLNSPGVMIVNETFVGRFFADEEPLGQRIRAGMRLSEEDPESFEIVGIVADVADAIPGEARPYMYVPHRQQTWPFMSFAVRTTVEPESLIGAVRAEVAALTQEEAAFDFHTMDGRFAELVARRRFIMFLLLLFAATALVLATIGLYGTLAHGVAQRTHEIGVRMAIGAQRSHVLRLILRQGAMLTAVGVAIGLVAAVAGSRLLAGVLYEISATDPVTFVGVPLLLICVALLACYLPARRATKVDPMVALRCE
jgi:putative ABC transport system permease protein